MVLVSDVTETRNIAFHLGLRILDNYSFLGDFTEGVTPVPIPNTEVKPLRADGTAWATAWETRSSPGIK